MKSLLERMNKAHEVADERACNTDCFQYRKGICPFPYGQKLRCYIYRMHYDDAFGEIPFED